MRRREYLRSLATLPVLPSIPHFGKNDSENGSRTQGEERFLEFSSGWFPQHQWGRTIIVEDDEIIHEWDFETREMWHKTTLLNAHTVAKDTPYVADLFGLNLRGLYIDPPYFSSRFMDEWNDVQIQQGKYSDHEYTYEVETQDEDGLHYVEGGADSIEKVVKEVSELINQ